MSRIGNRLIKVPTGVTIEENDGVVSVKGWTCIWWMGNYS